MTALSLLDAALACASLGLPVFPLVAGRKVPATARGFHAASTNPATIRRYWRVPDHNTVAFACSVAHSIHIRDQFIASGVRAEHIDGTTPKPERDATLARLGSGEIDIVSNCTVLTEGWDMPDVGACILARPTRRMTLYRQMVGRVIRPVEGNKDAIVLDHSGATFRHGFVDDPVEWTLDPDRRAKSPAHEKRGKTGTSRLLECVNCGVIRIAGEACWSCGYLPQRSPQPVKVVDGELGLVDRARRHANGAVYTAEDRTRWHAMLIYIRNERGYHPKFPAANYREKFGVWPPWGETPTPIPPSPEVRSWVRSRLIAYTKAKAKAWSSRHGYSIDWQCWIPPHGAR
jgi:hypothetical protein